MYNSAEMQSYDGKLGYVLLIGYPGSTCDPVCVEWAPRGRDGVDKLLANIRKSRPGVQTLHFFCGTPSDLTELRRGLRGAWTGVGPWFEQTGPMEWYLAELHRQACEEIARLDEEDREYEVQLIADSCTANLEPSPKSLKAYQRNLNQKRKNMPL